VIGEVAALGGTALGIGRWIRAVGTQNWHSPRF